MKVTNCCLDIAAKALEKSEEIAKESNKDLQTLLGCGSQAVPLNSTYELTDNIANSDLFKKGRSNNSDG